jgi:hypothetical protein
MIDQFLVSAIGDELATALPDVFIGRQHTNESISLPAVLIKVDGESVVGSPVYRGTLEVTLVTASADTTTAQHAQLAQDLDAAMRTMDITSAVVALYGLVPTSTAPDVSENQFRTVLSYTVGYGPVDP